MTLMHIVCQLSFFIVIYLDFNCTKQKDCNVHSTNVLVANLNHYGHVGSGLYPKSTMKNSEPDC